ncbi:MAG TPA: hypothetical protein DDX71_01385 [Ruminococcus sp.]|nr:hypothetical protein [Ruminococcus sp.]
MNLPESIGAPLDAMKKKLPRIRLRKLTRSEVLMMILSFALALLVWTYAAQTVSPDITQNLKNLPVNVDLTGSRAESYGLSLLLSDEDKDALDHLRVACDIKGSRTAIGGLSGSDVEVYVDFDSALNRIGEQELPLKVRSLTKKLRTDSLDCSLTPDHITLNMDRFEKQTVRVTNALCTKITSADDETMILTDEISIEPSTVEITGPSTRLSEIDHIQVVVDAEEKLNQTKTYTNITNYQFLDSSGNVVKGDAVSAQGAVFSVQIPVKYSRVLPLTISLKTPPAGFDSDWLLEHIRLNGDCKLPLGNDDGSTKHLEIAIETRDPALKDNLDELETYELKDQIPLSSLTIGGASLERTVQLEDGFTDGSNIGSVMISLDDTGLTSRTFWIKNSDIQLMNGSAAYKYSLQVPTGNTAITLIGTEEQLDLIEAEDLAASINLFNISAPSEGTSPQPFTVTLPDTVSRVWVSPLPRVNITVSLAG